MTATPRFLEFAQVGSVSVGPGDDLVLVGPLELAPNADTLWIRITQTSPSGLNNFAYGIVSWQSIDGRSLGSTKFYGSTVGEVFQLPVTRAPAVKQGQLVFMPRLYNLKWAREGGPVWSLTFEASSGSIAGSGSSNVDGVVSGVLADDAGDLLTFRMQDNGLAILNP